MKSRFIKSIDDCGSTDISKILTEIYEQLEQEYFEKDLDGFQLFQIPTIKNSELSPACGSFFEKEQNMCPGSIDGYPCKKGRSNCTEIITEIKEWKLNYMYVSCPMFKVLYSFFISIEENSMDSLNKIIFTY